jgi:Piwi domain
MKYLPQCSQIRAACTDVREDYRPPVTFVVVQKRHHTRLFPMSSREGDKSGNVMPGAHAVVLRCERDALHRQVSTQSAGYPCNDNSGMIIFAGTVVERSITVRAKTCPGSCRSIAGNQHSSSS